MILALDVHYGQQDTATVAGILFAEWANDAIVRVITKQLAQVAPYQPGLFFRRELPCLLALLEEIATPLDAIIVDGYVTLGAQAKPGLGMYLYESLGKSVPVIGVAKTRYADTPRENELFRGKSQRPLYVTAVGMPISEAKAHILKMHGKTRIPTLLKKVDQVCRQAAKLERDK
ncbi:MAG: endonuclease V [Thioalkalispiraceae bacterium]